MNAEEYETMYRVEDTLWWYRGMETISRMLIERNYARGGLIKIFDAGCGTGAGMKYLADYGTVTGLDFSSHALRFCRKRGTERLMQGSVNGLPLADQSFDLVTSFDVICCNGIDDEAALCEFNRVLVRGGRMVLRLPAYNWLRGAHDIAVNVGYRYTAYEIRQRLERAGFVTEHVSYANMWLFPLALLKRATESWLWPNQDHSDLSMDVGVLNGLLGSILASEALAVKEAGLPFGLTVAAVARKP
jgi:SAM-dependent methyltransferase